MAQTPRALLKDLLSTGYFYDDLKNYSGSADIDLLSYSRDYAIPHLLQMAQSHEKSGHPNRSEILNEAVGRLSSANDEALVDSIFELKKFVASEIDTNEKALHQLAPLDKAELLSCRQKSESAQALAKMLVSIVRVFKLTEPNTKRDKPKGKPDAKAEAVAEIVADAAPSPQEETEA